MNGDVVKSKSKFTFFTTNFLHILFVLIFLISSLPCFKKIYHYFSLSSTCPIIIENVTWQNPYINVTFTFSLNNNTYQASQNIPYLKIHTLAHFQSIQVELNSLLDQGYYNKARPNEVYLSRTFPFKLTIGLLLLSATYTASTIFIKNILLKGRKGFFITRNM